MLECYIDANKPGNRKRRQQEDPFYQKLKSLRESQEKWEEKGRQQDYMFYEKLQRLRELQKEWEKQKRKQSDNPDEDPKR